MIRKVIFKVFPDARPVTKHPSIKSQNNWTPRKLVVLLGWGGCRSRNLDKVVEFYNSKGVTTVSHVMPLGIPDFLRSYFERALTEEIHVSNGEREKVEVYYHVFSNNGAWCYSGLSRRHDFPYPKKVVMDSSPFIDYDPSDILQGARLLSRVWTSIILRASPPIYDHAFISPFLRTLLIPMLSFWEAVKWIETRLTFGTSINSNDYCKNVGSFHIVTDYNLLNEILRFGTPCVPTLFVYSTGDKLIPIESVRNFITVLKGRSGEGRVDIEELVLGDEIHHTAAFYKASKAYKKKLQEFLDLPS